MTETPGTLVIGGRAGALAGTRQGFLSQAWFMWPLALRLITWLVLAQSYEMAVFEDASWQMVSGAGVYGRFATWWAAVGDGYYAYPPLYAYMLWVSGRVAAFFGGHWWVHQLLIKAWLVLADAALMIFLYRVRPAAARAYWTLWFVPIVAIGQVQPDLWIGLSIVLAWYSAMQWRWVAVGFLIAFGAGLKLVPFVILPFLAIYLGQLKNWTAIGQMSAGVVAGAIVAWLPYVVLFGDWVALTEVVRFHLARPAAGLTFPSGLSMLINAWAGAATLLGYPTWSLGDSVLQFVGNAQPILTVVVLAALMIAAARQRWPLRQVFCVPLLTFLLVNKVIHEHYLLQVLPLLLLSSIGYRNLGVAYAVYLLAAGSPLRFFPGEFGLPPTPDALLPMQFQPTIGAGITIVVMIATAIAAMAFSWQLFRMLRSLTIEACTGAGRPT